MMKKLRYLFSTFLLLLVAGVTWADSKTLTVTLTGFGDTANSYATDVSVKDDGNNITLVANQLNRSTGQVRGNQTSVANNFNIANTEEVPGYITGIKIETTTGTGTFSAAMNAAVGTTSQASATSGPAGTKASDSKSISWTFDASNKYTYFRLFSAAKFTSGSVTGCVITITYEEGTSGPTLLDPNLAFAEASGTVALDGTATLPALTNDGDGAVTYSSSETGVATVSETTGGITLVGVGTTVITATSAATSTYKAGSAEYTLNVTPGGTLIWSEDFSNGVDNYTLKNGDSVTKLYESDNLAGGTAPELLIGKTSGSFTATIPLQGYYGNLTLGFKANKNNTPTVSTTTADVTIGSQTGENPYYYTINVPSGTPNLELTFSNTTSANVRVDDFVLYGITKSDKNNADLAFAQTRVSLEVGQTTIIAFTKATSAAVTFENSDPTVATYNEATGQVEALAAGTATITASSEETDDYTAGIATLVITVTEPLTLTGDGTEENPYTVADALALLADGQTPEGVYVKGIVSKIVTPYNPEFGNISYNISDDGTTEAGQLEAYRGLGLNGEGFTSENDILPGDEVVVFGALTIFNNTTMELAQGNWLYSHTRNTPEVTKYYLNGSFNEWAEGIEFTYNATDNTYTLADQTLAAAAEVKISDSNNNWYGTAADGLYWVTADNHTDLAMTTGNNEPNYYFDEAGTYTFTISFTDTGAPLLTVTGWPEPPVVVEEGDYVKVTSTDDLVDGAEYLIVYEDGSVAFDGGLETLDAAGNTIEVTISDNTIKGNATVDAATFTIDVTTGTILSKSGKYIGRTSDANGLQAADDALTNTISIDEEGNAVILASGGAYLRYNATSGQDRFRYFKAASYANQKAIQLYRKVAEVVAPVDYYLIGTFNEWNQETMVKFTRSGNTYTAEQAIEAGGEFKILDPNTGEYGSWYGGPTPEATYNVNSGWYENLPMATDGKNYQINEAGTYTFTITVTDEAGPRLTVTGWPEPKYYLTGSFNNWDESVEFVYDEATGNYTATQEVANGDYFKIKCGFAENPNDFTWYGAITDDGNNYRIHDEWYENIPLDANGSDIEIEINETTTLTFTLDANNMTLTVTGWPETPVDGAERYVLVTDASELAEGDEIIFVGQIEGEGYYSMNNAESANNRKASQITCDGTNATVGEDIVPYTLVSASNEDTEMWMFKDADDKFLYAASSSSNQLKLTSDPDDNAKAIISIEDGVAYVEFQGSNTRSTMQFNPNKQQGSYSPMFSCYNGASQKPVAIYKKQLLTTVDVTIGATGYATLYYSDMNLTVPEGVTAKTFKIEDGALTESVSYTENQIIPAGEAVVLEGDQGEYAFTIVAIAGPADEANMLRGTDAATKIDEEGYKYYILSKSSDGQEVGFYYQSGDGSSVNNGAHKAYLAVPVEVAGSAKGWSFDGEATGINAVINGAAVEGKAEIYNLSGVRMNSQNLPKGIYIVNGKKMVVK